MFSKACEYAIRATLCIASRASGNDRIGVTEIAARIDSPEAFTAKLLQKLVHAGIVLSIKGHGGGFHMPEPLTKKVVLQDIVDTIDGNNVYTRCALGLPQCSSTKPCPLHEEFEQVRFRLSEMLGRTTIHDLVTSLGDGRHVLKH